MLENLVFIFLFVFFHLAVSQIIVDKCPADPGVAMVKQAGIEDIVSGAVFLDSSHPCGGGLWKMVANLNMSNPLQQCPSGWREYSNNESAFVRSCGRPVNSNGGCLSTLIKTENFEYSQVCGRIIGYQVNTPDAFNRYSESDPNNISNAYVDGISLTHGNSPRKHIWTFAAGSNEHGDEYGCPCGNRSNAAMNASHFVADNFFCESARDESSFSHDGFFTNDALWDGKDCAISSCCDLNNPPWFIAKLESATSDDIELRLCLDQSESDEDVAIELWEIYVQ